MNPYDASQLPVARSSFSTQGTVDWTRLAELSVTFPLAILARCAANGVDPYTIIVGQALAQRLPLGLKGDQNVQRALSDLRVYSGFANALDIGFGLSSFVRTLGKTNQGRSLLALSSALSECYPQDFAAQVMHCITLQHEPPAGLRPSVNEWLNVVRACSGSISATKFPLVAEGLMRLDPRSQRLTSNGVNIFDQPVRGDPSPESIADAIIGIGKIASKELNSITVIGCAAAGWLAAVAEWLFDLTIRIHDSTGTALYATEGLHDDVQVLVIYQSETSITDDLEITRKTYFIKDCSEIFRQYGRAESYVATVYGGRLPWESCLKSSFGVDFEQLMEIPINVGIALGSAARIFKAIALAEPGLKAPSHKSFFDASSGQGFVSSALRRFPELAPIQKHMDTGVRFGLLDAITQYEEKLAAIRRHCKCCSSHSTANASWESNGFCLVVLFETILSICRFMAGVDVAGNLCPTRNGFEALYNTQSLLRTILKDRWVEEIGPIAYVLDHTADEARTMFKNVAYGRIVDALTLFTGLHFQTDSTDISAMRVGGICAYLDTLREFSLDPELVGLVHVVPGHIERDDKPYQAIRDSWRKVEEQKHQIQPTSILGTLNQASLEVTEMADALEVSYLLHSTYQGGVTVSVCPMDLVHSVLAARGLVHCPKPSIACAKVSMDDRVEDRTEHPFVKLKSHGKEIIAYDAVVKNDYVRAALFMFAQGRKRLACMISDHQCMDCCLKKALEWEVLSVLII